MALITRRRWSAVAPAAVVVAALGGSLAAAQDGAERPDTLTPEGPATVRDKWNGAHTLEGRPPEVVVGWKVRVGAGGTAGPVRLRVLRAIDKGTVVGSGPVEQLPAAPGTYAFAVRPGIPYDGRSEDLALDQETGGHAIVKTHPAEPEMGEYADPARLHALDVFRPPLADGARGVAVSERRGAQELLVDAVIETDHDEDRLGDKTQDLGDLRLLGARVAGRRGRLLLIRARVRNVGETVRHLPHVVPPESAWSHGCVGRRQAVFRCPSRPLAPGAEAEVAVLAGGPFGRSPDAAKARRAFPPRRLSVASEGTDTNPGDNTGVLTPRLTLRAVPGGVSLRSSHRGTVRLVARCKGERVVRRVRLGLPGRRTVALSGPRGCRVTASLRGARAVVRLSRR